MTIRYAAVAIALVAAGCAAENPGHPAQTHTIADSGGVTIVTNFSGTWTENTRWEISADPVLEIGAVDGDEAYLFKRIGGAHRLPGGGVVAAGETDVRLYDEEGGHVRTEGRKGEGPGEFEYIRAIMACEPGHFNVYDLDWRQSTYTPDGDFVETRRIFPNGVRPYTLRCTASGTFLGLLWAPQALEGHIGLYETETSMIVGHAETTVDTIVTVSGGQRLGQEFGSRPHPFGTVTSFAAVGDSIAISTGEAYEYRVFDLQGELLRIVRMPERNRRIQTEDIDAQARQDAQRFPPELFDRYFEEYRNIEMTERYPAYSQLLVDSDRNVWLRHHVRPLDTVQRWDITDEAGVFLGSIEFDAGVEIEQIGRDFVIGDRKTDEDVPQVAVWGVLKL